MGSKAENPSSMLEAKELCKMSEVVIKQSSQANSKSPSDKYGFPLSLNNQGDESLELSEINEWPDAAKNLAPFLSVFDGKIGFWVYANSCFESWLDNQLPRDSNRDLTLDHLKMVTMTFVRALIGNAYRINHVGRKFPTPVIKPSIVLAFVDRLIGEGRIQQTPMIDAVLNVRNPWREMIQEETNYFMQELENPS